LKNTIMTKPKPESEVDNVVQRLSKEGPLIAYFLVAIFILIALVSYSPNDPAFMTTGSSSVVSNAVGVSGAMVADILLHLMGYLAYGFPAFLAYKIVESLRDKTESPEFSWALFGFKALGLILLVVSACGLATLHFEVAEDASYMAGGMLGALVVDFSRPVLAILGTTLVLFATFLFGLTITAAISWLDFIDRVGAATLRLMSGTAEKFDKWLEDRK
jgi:S-DNA-T family DNA segregation ATPase FtsK/SpoIIIE